jgi:hypothetical protein
MVELKICQRLLPGLVLPPGRRMLEVRKFVIWKLVLDRCRGLPFEESLPTAEDWRASGDEADSTIGEGM